MGMFDGVNKAGEMAQDRLAMVTPQQVKNIADNVERSTAAARDILEDVRDVIRFVKSKIGVTQ